MAIEQPVHVNECGLPLNAIEWLVTHHRSKLIEREEMIQDFISNAAARSLTLAADQGFGLHCWRARSVHEDIS